MNITRLKVDDIRKELRSRGLDTSGTRPALLKRLRAALDQDKATSKGTKSGNKTKPTNVSSKSPSKTTAVPLAAVPKMPSPPPQSSSVSAADARVDVQSPASLPVAENASVRRDAPDSRVVEALNDNVGTEDPSVASAAVVTAGANATEEVHFHGDDAEEDAENSGGDGGGGGARLVGQEETGSLSKALASDAGSETTSAAAAATAAEAAAVVVISDGDGSVGDAEKTGEGEDGPSWEELKRLRQMRFGGVEESGTDEKTQKAGKGTGEEVGTLDPAAVRRRHARFGTRGRSGKTDRVHIEKEGKDKEGKEGKREREQVRKRMMRFGISGAAATGETKGRTKGGTKRAAEETRVSGKEMEQRLKRQRRFRGNDTISNAKGAE